MSTTRRGVVRWTSMAVLLSALAVLGRVSVSTAQEKAVVIPPPATAETASQKTSEIAVFAGGCFWGVQAVYQHVKGVTAAVSGYAGGQKSTAQYEIVSRGGSGHAESVQVTYDPRQVSYGQLLQVLFSVVHDPTQLNRQGPDTGTQYRSAVFPLNPEQDRIARAYIAQLGQARVFKAAIVTKIEADRPFFPAEEYHQDFLQKNPRNPYIVINDLPKIGELKKTFPELYRAAPVLVGSR